MSKQPQCPECIGGTLRSTVQKIIIGPYKGLIYDDIESVLDRVCARADGYLRLAESYALVARDDQDETPVAVKSRKWRRRKTFKGGMTLRQPQCTGCIGDNLRRVVQDVCSGKARDLGYFITVGLALDEVYGRVAGYLELAKLHAFVIDAWQAQCVTCSSARSRGWSQGDWQKYVGKNRDKGLGWLARAGLVVKGQKGWEWTPGVTLKDVFAADPKLRAFAEMRRCSRKS